MSHHVLLDLHRRRRVGPDRELGVVGGRDQIAGHRLGERRGVEVPEVAGVNHVDRPPLEHLRDVFHQVLALDRGLEGVATAEVLADLLRVGGGNHRKIGDLRQESLAAVQGRGEDRRHRRSGLESGAGRRRYRAP